MIKRGGHLYRDALYNIFFPGIGCALQPNVVIRHFVTFEIPEHFNSHIIMILGYIRAWKFQALILTLKIPHFLSPLFLFKIIFLPFLYFYTKNKYTSVFAMTYWKRFIYGFTVMHLTTRSSHYLSYVSSSRFYGTTYFGNRYTRTLFLCLVVRYLTVLYALIQVSLLLLWV